MRINEKQIVVISFWWYWVPWIHPPKPTFHHYVLEIYVRTQTRNLHFLFILQKITSPFHKNHTRKNNEQTKKIQTPPQVSESRPIHSLKVIIGRLPGTPPGRPKRSQNLPRELPRTLRALRGPSRTPGPSERPGSYKTWWLVTSRCNRSPTKKR